MNEQIKCWISKKYMAIIIIILLLYLGGAFLAPVFMKIGLNFLAYPIYHFYSSCHQLAFRSWFLFGEQGFYPRNLANINGVKTYEEVVRNTHLHIDSARKLLGDEILGYKIALCQRDIAIYGSLLIAAVIFWITGKKINPIPCYLWFLIGILPIALDGITQLGGLGIKYLSWLPNRESTPLLRAISGSLFGVTTGFISFPLLERSMKNNRKNYCKAE